MKRSTVIAALTGLVCLAGLAVAQSYVDQILLVDVKSNGTIIHYFTRNPPLYWNFKGGATINTSTKSLDIGPDVQSVDGGISTSGNVTIGGTVSAGAFATLGFSTFDSVYVGGNETVAGQFDAPQGVMIGTTYARPTCTSSNRGTFYTVESNATGDAGVKDLTYQCCKAADGTYSWIAVACQ